MEVMSSFSLTSELLAQLWARGRELSRTSFLSGGGIWDEWTETPFPWLSTLGGSPLSDRCGLNQLPSAQTGLGWRRRRRMNEGSDYVDGGGGRGRGNEEGAGKGQLARVAEPPYPLAYYPMTKLRWHPRGTPPVHSPVSPLNKHWLSPSSRLDTARPPQHTQSTVNTRAGGHRYANT